jgi:hypothetical protein
VQRIPTHAGSKTMALNSKTHEVLVPSNASGTIQIRLFGNRLRDFVIFDRFDTWHDPSFSCGTIAVR